MSNDELLTTEEALRFLRIRKADLLRLYRQRPRSKNPLRAHKVGRRWLYSREDLLAWSRREAHLDLQRLKSVAV